MSRGDLKGPDIQLLAGAVMCADDGFTPPSDHALHIGPTVLKPTSRGKVMLRSARPDAKPRITCNFLTTSEDMQAMIAGVRIALNVAKQPSLAAVTRAPYQAPASDGEADIVSYVKRYTSTLFHPTSTCSMGRVVDSELRVLGVEGLRVVDASVMPTITSGNTNTPTAMIAEKGASMILEDSRAAP
jgi:choline dehydrogenase